MQEQAKVEPIVVAEPASDAAPVSAPSPAEPVEVLAELAAQAAAQTRSLGEAAT